MIIINDPAFEAFYDARKAEQEAEKQAQLRERALRENPELVPNPPADSQSDQESQKPEKYRGPITYFFSDEELKSDNVDISNKGIQGHLRINGADFPNLRKFNGGGNLFSDVTVSDCPHLWFLNYAHNDLDKGCRATINNCPKLLPENIHCENCDAQYNWLLPDDSVGTANEDNLTGLSFLKQAAQLTWLEILTELKKFDSLDANLRVKIIEIASGKFNTEILQTISKYLNKEIDKDQFLAKIESCQPYFDQLLNEFTRDQLKRLISSLTEKQVMNSTDSTPLWPWLGIGIGYVILVGLLGYTWFIPRKKF